MSQRLKIDENEITGSLRKDTCAAHETELRLVADEASTLARLAKALAHPVRVQIVDILSRYGGEVCVCEIEHHFDLTQPTISHHLKVLREAGLIDAEQRSVWLYYRLRRGAFQPLRGLLGQLD